jgi:hypothetical protein
MSVRGGGSRRRACYAPASTASLPPSHPRQELAAAEEPSACGVPTGHGTGPPRPPATAHHPIMELERALSSPRAARYPGRCAAARRTAATPPHLHSRACPEGAKHAGASDDTVKKTPRAWHGKQAYHCRHAETGHACGPRSRHALFASVWNSRARARRSNLSSALLLRSCANPVR